jgi:hypothetical protein
MIDGIRKRKTDMLLSAPVLWAYTAKGSSGTKVAQGGRNS